MPLHDWSDERGWDSVYPIWLSQLLDWVQPRIPAEYRAHVRSIPPLNNDDPDEDKLLYSIHVEYHGRLIAAIELTSPRNKNKASACTQYLERYVGYLRDRVHLMLIDVLPRPAGYSFAEAIAVDLGFTLPPTPPPSAVSYRVGEPLPEGTLLAFWRRPLVVNQPLGVIPLALNTTQAITIDLEQTYQQAARRAYLD